MKGLAALFAVLLAVPAFAAEIATTLGPSEVQGPPQEIHKEVSDLKDAVANKAVPDRSVYEMAHNLFDRVPGTDIHVQINTRSWDIEPRPNDDPADVGRLVDTATERLAHFKGVPPPDSMVRATQYAEGMSRSGKVAFDKAGKMDDREMGVYEYVKHKSELGTVTLNEWLAWIATKVGDAFAYATLVHEAGHARDHQDGNLSPDEVVNGEIRAFQTQYHWLAVIDPYGERLSYMRAHLIYAAKIHPNKINLMALAYADSLADLRATGGDADKIRKMVEKLGYEEGRGAHHSGTSA